MVVDCYNFLHGDETIPVLALEYLRRPLKHNDPPQDPKFNKVLARFYSDDAFAQQQLCYVAYQVMQRLSELHSREIVHSDIKPANILTGLDQLTRRTLYLIDFGLRAPWEWKSPKTGSIQTRTGTTIFESVV